MHKLPIFTLKALRKTYAKAFRVQPPAKPECIQDADLLITSKSSFSYKPALLSKGLKVCPKDFWHGYPDTSDWILVDEKGSFYKEIIMQ
jgi:hypothetical protein